MIASLATLLLLLQGPGDLPQPEAFFGHKPGEDRKIVPYPKVVEYLERLDAASDRVELLELGKSTLGKRFVMAAISSPANLKAARRSAEISKTLLGGRVDEAEARRLARQGKAIVLITCNIHSTEIASSQTAPELAYELARGRLPLDEAILLLMPSINPDGQVLIQEWYDKYLGTEYEGGPMPRLYHPYSGHDNNRDGFMLNLIETRHVAEAHYKTWFPQVAVDHHQMGPTGGRMWVPPYAEPMNVNLHPLIHRWLNVFGTHMALDLERSGRDGVQSQKMFEAYWPGATDSTPWWHNRIGILTESASCRIATPLFVDGGEATSKQEGVVQPRPWKGGWWRQRDIVEQQLTASYAVLDVASRYREEILLSTWRMARDQVERGASEAPYAYVLPREQRDPSALARLVKVLAAVGVEVLALEEPLVAGGRAHPAGTILIPLAQADRPYVKNLFERQSYPLKEKPYDVAGWTLPLQMGVEAVELREKAAWKGRPIQEVPAGPPPEVKGDFLAILPGSTSAHALANRLLARGERVSRLAVPHGDLPPGTFVVANNPALWESLAAEPVRGVRGALPAVYELKPARLAVYQAWRASMDEGWTRLVLEQFEFKYETVHNDRVKKGELRKDFDAVLIPAMPADFVREGRSKEDKEKPQTFPPEVQGGLAKEGVAELKKFVEAGGTLILVDAACNVAIEDWGPPVRNALKDDKDFSCPGSILKAKVDPAHPLGFGMPEDAFLYFTNSPAFQTSVPARVDIDRRVVARYDEEESALASGYLNQPEKLKGRSALVEVPWGKGRIVLFGFRPQHRAQSYGTFKMLFNAIRMSAAERKPGP